MKYVTRVRPPLYLSAPPRDIQLLVTNIFSKSFILVIVMELMFQNIHASKPREYICSYWLTIEPSIFSLLPYIICPNPPNVMEWSLTKILHLGLDV